MPTYEYRCQICGYEFEKMQSITADALKDCPQCGSAVERLFSQGSGFIMKNSSASSVQSHAPCCGKREPCEHPKRCCEVSR